MRVEPGIGLAIRNLALLPPTVTAPALDPLEETKPRRDDSTTGKSCHSEFTAFQVGVRHRQENEEGAAAAVGGYKNDRIMATDEVGVACQRDGGNKHKKL